MLENMIREFIQGTATRQERILRGGLVVVYTRRPGLHELTITRAGVDPSPTEKKVMKDTLVKIIGIHTPLETDYIQRKGKAKSTQTYHAWVYRWPISML